ERLEDEARRLSHSEDLTELAGGLHQAISLDDQGVLTALGSLRRSVEQLVRIDPGQSGAAELYDSAYYALEELGERMGHYLSQVEHDPARLEEIRHRQDLIFRLKSKYGATLEEVVATGRAAREELDLIDRGGFELTDLQKREARAAAALGSLAAELTARRRRAVEALGAEVN